jgi:hypothetical protein
MFISVAAVVRRGAVRDNFGVVLKLRTGGVPSCKALCSAFRPTGRSGVHERYDRPGNHQGRGKRGEPTMTTLATTRVSPSSGLGGSLRRTEKSVIAALGVAFLLGLPCRGQAAFSCSTPSFDVQNFAEGGGPASVVMADFNHDGRADLAVANPVSSSISIFLGDGSGGFGAATNFAAGSGPLSVAVGNFNGDTYVNGDPILDVAVTDFLSGQVSVLLGDGSGSFGPASSFAVGDQPVFVAAADLRNDGKADLIVLDYSKPTANAASGGEVSVLLGNGDGTFNAASHFGVGNSPAGFAVGYFNNDAYLDLVVANHSGGQVSVLLGDGIGRFGTPNSFPAGGDAFFVAVGDFNRDGKEDLAVATTASGAVSVLLGQGDGTFAAPTTFPVGGNNASVVSVAVADFNGDDQADLAVLDNESNTVSVLLGNGDGTFGTGSDFAVENGPGLLVVGDCVSGKCAVNSSVSCSVNADCKVDLNGDGTTDIVATNFSANSVSVLLNTCGAPIHDTVVLPIKPITMTIQAGSSSTNKTLSVHVRNADTTHTLGHMVKLDVDDSDCGAPGTVAGPPTFPRVQNRVTIADGKAKIAKVVLTASRAAFTSFNRNAPYRCTLRFRASTDIGELSADPTPSNNTFPVELNVIDLNDPDQTTVHETTIASLKPLALTITHGQASKTKTVRPTVGNADANDVQSDLINAVAADGTCPHGTVGSVDLSRMSGTQSSATVAGGTIQGGTLPVTATSTVSTPNHLAPQRCVATVSAMGPSNNVDPSPRNNTTQLVIDIIDRNDF